MCVLDISLFVIRNCILVKKALRRGALLSINCRQIATAYIGATSGAVFASVGLNSLLVVRSNQVSKYHTA